MTLFDKNGAGIRIGDRVLQRYQYREDQKQVPFRGKVESLEARPASGTWVVTFREDHTEHLRSGDNTTVEYDWNPPKEADDDGK